MPRSKKQKRRDAKRLAAAIRGEDRRIHFASGGSVREWRGSHSVHTSRAEKRKDRGTDQRQAIRESSEEK